LILRELFFKITKSLGERAFSDRLLGKMFEKAVHCVFDERVPNLVLVKFFSEFL